MLIYSSAILKACHQFHVKATALNAQDIEHLLLEDARNKGEEVDADYAKRLAEDVVRESKKLKAPRASDKQDIVILLKRAANAITSQDIKKFISSMDSIKDLSQRFAPEKFDSEFADFVLDMDTWDWLEGLKKKPQPDGSDLEFLKILRDNLLYLVSKMS